MKIVHAPPGSTARCMSLVGEYGAIWSEVTCGECLMNGANLVQHRAYAVIQIERLEQLRLNLLPASRDRACVERWLDS